MSKLIQLSVNSMVDIIAKKAVAHLRRKGTFGKEFAAFMLWGQPGIGKSQGIREVAKRIEELTGKKVNLVDVRLLLFNPVDLRGIPTADANKENAVWLKPQIFQLDSSEDIINIVFLDELSAAPVSVQAAAYQLVLDKMVGEHKFPDNTIVLAAGNRLTDKAVAVKMPSALADRFKHFEIVGDSDAWRAWAIREGFDPMITGFIAFKPSALNTFDPKNDELVFATPRSWQSVDDDIKDLGMHDAVDLISATIGIGLCTEFLAFTETYMNLPNTDDIFAGKDVAVPTNPSVLYAMSSKLASEANKLIELDQRGMVKKVDVEKLTHLANYLSKMPVSFATLTTIDILSVKGNISGLLKVQAFAKWAKDCKKYIK